RAELDDRMRLNNWSIAASYDTARIFAGLVPLGRGAPRPYRFRRMAPPLTGSSLILHRRYAQELTRWHAPGRRTKEATRTTKLVALVLVCLMSGTAMAQEPKVTSLMSKDLAESPGREVLVITVEHAPGESSAIHRHNAHAFVYVLEGSVVNAAEGWTTGDTDTRTDLL